MSEKDARFSGVDDIQFFSDVDKKWDKGTATITSTYPAWFFKNQLDAQKAELETRTRKKRNEPDVIYTDQTVDPEYIAETKALQSRVKEIEESRPKLNGAQKNFLTKSVSELDGNIQASLFAYDDMHTGAASAHSELDRQLKPCIPIDKRLATSLNLKSYKGGKVSRDDASIASQIIHAAMDDEHSIEGMRPKNMTFRTQRITPFTGNNQPIVEVDLNGREATAPSVA